MFVLIEKRSRSKTELILFSWKYKKPTIKPISLGVIVISFADSAK